MAIKVAPAPHLISLSPSLSLPNWVMSLVTALFFLLYHLPFIQAGHCLLLTKAIFSFHSEWFIVFFKVK